MCELSSLYLRAFLLIATKWLRWAETRVGLELAVEVDGKSFVCKTTVTNIHCTGKSTVFLLATVTLFIWAIFYGIRIVITVRIKIDLVSKFLYRPSPLLESRTRHDVEKLLPNNTKTSNLRANALYTKARLVCLSCVPLLINIKDTPSVHALELHAAWRPLILPAQALGAVLCCR